MHENHSQDHEAPSKSELKRQMTALQQLGERLVGLSELWLKQIPMPEELSAAVYRARKITQRGGLRRELQYIGKVMRHIDVEPIQDALDQLDAGQQQQNESFHELENWRDRLLHEADSVTEFYNLYPDVDLQQLRQQLRLHQSAKNPAQKTKAYRQIFQLIKAAVN